MSIDRLVQDLKGYLDPRLDFRPTTFPLRAIPRDIRDSFSKYFGDEVFAAQYDDSSRIGELLACKLFTLPRNASLDFIRSLRICIGLSPLDSYRRRKLCRHFKDGVCVFSSPQPNFPNTLLNTPETNPHAKLPNPLAQALLEEERQQRAIKNQKNFLESALKFRSWAFREETETRVQNFDIPVAPLPLSLWLRYIAQNINQPDFTFDRSKVSTEFSVCPRCRKPESCNDCLAGILLGGPNSSFVKANRGNYCRKFEVPKKFVQFLSGFQEKPPNNLNFLRAVGSLLSSNVPSN